MSTLDTIADKAQAAPDRPAGSGGGAQKDGPSPFLVLGAGFAAGIVLAKWIDWRGHVHPRG